MPTLQADLDLELDAALRRISDLDDAFDQVAQNFASALTESLGTVQTDPIETGLTSAADTFGVGLQQALSDAAALAGEPVDLQVDADTSSIPDEVQGALFSVDSTIPVDADTSAAETAVNDLAGEIDGTQAEIEVDADTSTAEAAIGDLGDAAESAGGQMQDAAGGADKLGVAAGVLQGGAALARGEVGGLGEAAAGLPPQATAGVAVVGALAASTVFLFNAGVDATSALQRFNTIVGDMGDEVRQVDVGTLHQDLDKLALSLGTDDEALRNAAASLFQFSINSGASRTKAAEFTDQVIALAARAVALNPALGSVSDVAESMAVRLQRGGRFAAQFGLALQASEIQTRAQGDTGKTAAADLTIFEKSAAAAEIAVGRYGQVLGSDVKNGTHNAALEQKSLQEELNNVFEAAGKPLVSPMFDLFKESKPLIKDFATVVTDLAQIALPILIETLQAVKGPLHTFTEGFTFATDAISSVAGFLGDAVGAVGGFIGITHDAKAETHDFANELRGLGDQEALSRFDEEAAKVERFGSKADVAKVKLSGFKNIAEDNVGVAQRLISAMEANGVSTDRYQAILDKVVAKEKARKDAQEASDTAQQSLTGSTDAGTAATQAAADALQKLVDAEVSAATSALPGVGAAFDTATQAAQYFGTTVGAAPDLLVVAFQRQLEATSHFTENIGTLFNAGLTELAATIAEKGPTAGGQLAQTLADGIRNGQPEVANELNAQATTIGVQGSIYEQKMRDEWGPAIIAGRNAAFQNLAPGISVYMGLATDAVTGAAGPLGIAGGTTGDAALDNLLGEIGKAAPGVDTAMGAAQTAVSNAQPGLAGAGGSTGTAASTAFNTGVAAVSTGTEVALGVVQGLFFGAIEGSLGAAIAGVAIGRSFSSGVAAGIAEGSSGVQDAAGQVVRDAEREARRVAHSSSPSLLFAALGEDLSAGVAVGMFAGTGMVEKSASQLIDAAARAAGGGVAIGGRSGAQVAGGIGGPITVKVDVHGVSDPNLARAAGRSAGEGVVDGMLTRGVIVAARTG